MTGRTHCMTSVNSLWLLTTMLPYCPQDQLGLLLLTASLGLLLPNLDAPESKIKHLQIGGVKPFFLPAQEAYRTDMHRGMLHSLMGVAFISLTTLPLAFTGGGLP